MKDYVRVEKGFVRIVKESPLKCETDVVVNVSKRFLLIAGQFAEVWGIAIGEEIEAAINNIGDRAHLLKGERAAIDAPKG